MLKRTMILAIFALSALFVQGCGNSGYIQAKGRVVKGGQPFQLPEGMGFRLVFAPLETPEGDKYDSYAAAFDPADSTFFVMGKNDKGLPPGKYRVSIEMLKKKEDLLGGKLMGAKSPIICDVTPPANDLVIDLDQAKFDSLLEEGTAKVAKKAAKKSRG